MEYLTLEDLKEAGINPPAGEAEQFIKHANEVLTERIGAEITGSLSEEEADEMLAIQESGDEAALQGWIGSHVPELIEIVQDEIDILLDELGELGSKSETST